MNPDVLQYWILLHNLQCPFLAKTSVEVATSPWRSFLTAIEPSAESAQACTKWCLFEKSEESLWGALHVEARLPLADGHIGLLPLPDASAEGLRNLLLRIYMSIQHLKCIVESILLDRCMKLIQILLIAPSQRSHHCDSDYLGVDGVVRSFH